MRRRNLLLATCIALMWSGSAAAQSQPAAPGVHAPVRQPSTSPLPAAPPPTSNGCRSRLWCRTRPTLPATSPTVQESRHRRTESRRHHAVWARRTTGRTARRCAASRSPSASAATRRATTCRRASLRLSNRSHLAERFIQRLFSARASLRRDGQNSLCAGRCSEPVRWLHGAVGNEYDVGSDYDETPSADEAGVLHLLSGSSDLQHQSVRHRFRTAVLPERMYGYRWTWRCAPVVRAVGDVPTHEGCHVSPLSRPLLRYSFRVSLSA